MTLDECKPGKYEVLDLESGHKFNEKMACYGLYTGQIIDVVDNKYGFPLRIKVLGSTYSVGRGMCKKIEVRRLDG